MREISVGLLFAPIAISFILLCSCSNDPDNHMVQLTRDEEILACVPLWLPQGDRILFGGQTYAEIELCSAETGMWSMDTNGGNIQLILSGDPLEPIGSVLEPFDISDDGYIIFTSYMNNIYYLSPNLDNPTLICEGTNPAIAGNLDGIYNLACFMDSTDSPVPGIYLTDIYGSEPRLLVADSNHPSFSPDDSHMVYVQCFTNSVCVMDLASGQSEVIYSGNCVFSPHFSPDGKWIAFATTRDDDDKAEVYIIPATGGEPTRLTTYPYDIGLSTPGATYLSWSPDGQWIVYNLDLNELWKVSVQ